MTTTAQRVAKHRAKAAQDGYRRLSLSLPPDCVQRLKTLSTASGESRSQVIIKMIRVTGAGYAIPALSA